MTFSDEHQGCCYLPPNDPTTQISGPLDEDLVSHAPVKGGVGDRLVARDGRVLEQCVCVSVTRLSAVMLLDWVGYQDDDEPAPLVLDALHQRRQLPEVWIQDKVQLTLHVVDVRILDVLQDTTVFRGLDTPFP